MKIGLTYTGSEVKHQNYINWLKKEGGIEIVTLSDDPEKNEGDIQDCEGIVLSGGIDIHPKHYKNKNENYLNAPGQFGEARDEFEIAVFNKAQENNLPLLAVCRGMQLVNCILGGNLIQDLDEQNNLHIFEEKDKAHDVTVTPGSLLDEIVHFGKGVTNSAHHQAVNELGKGLQVNCTSDDGIIEGLEWKDRSNKSFLLCVQWHPERMYKFGLEHSPLSEKIRDRFIDEIKKSMAEKNENH